MSAAQRVDELLRGAGKRDARADARRARRDLLARDLPKVSISIPAALYVAQDLRCFHCGGFIPMFARHTEAHAPSREHALAAGVVFEEHEEQERWAVVLTHRLCNEDRGTRPFTAAEWQRAAKIWTDTSNLWRAAGGLKNPFLPWIALAQRMQEETAP